MSLKERMKAFEGGGTSPAPVLGPDSISKPKVHLIKMMMHDAHTRSFDYVRLQPRVGAKLKAASIFMKNSNAVRTLSKALVM